MLCRFNKIFYFIEEVKIHIHCFIIFMYFVFHFLYFEDVELRSPQLPLRRWNFECNCMKQEIQYIIESYYF